MAYLLEMAYLLGMGENLKKMKVLYQLNELSYSGTTKAILSFCKYLDRDRFEPFLFYPAKPKNLRYYRLKFSAMFSKKAQFRFQEIYLIGQARVTEFQSILGVEHICSGTWDDFKNFVNEIHPDLIHFSRGDENDWYTDGIGELPKSIALVETSIFGKASTPGYMERIDLVFLITEWVKSKTPWFQKKGKSLYLPILTGAHKKNLRARLGISDSELVVGRISRPGLDSGEEVLEIFRKIKTPCRLLFLGGGKVLIEEAKINDKVIYLPATTNDEELSDFYNSMDVMLHYRREGETFGMSIADAMIHGKPVVSHVSFLDNAQAELLATKSANPSGIVVEENDFTDHAAKINLLLTNPELRKEMGQAAQKRAQLLFEAKAVTKKLEAEYQECLAQKKSKSPA